MITALKKFVFAGYGVNGPDSPKSVIPVGLPASLMRRDIPTIWGAVPRHYLQYVVSPKADGVRMVMGWCRYTKNDQSDGSQPAVESIGFTMDRKGTARKLPWPVPEQSFEGTLLDCELVHDGQQQLTLWIFDALRINGHDIRNVAYHSRLAAAAVFLDSLAPSAAKKSTITSPFRKPEVESGPEKEPAFTKVPWECSATGSINPYGNYVVAVGQQSLKRLSIKPIWYHHHVNQAMEWIHRMPGIKEDGLIFTPVTRSVSVYRSTEVFKWKPITHHTVDFLVRDVPDRPNEMLLFVVDEDNKPVLYASVPLRIENPTMLIKPDQIYECKMDLEEHTWVIVRHRDDKTQPNAKLTADLTCQNIAENITLEELVPRVV